MLCELNEGDSFKDTIAGLVRKQFKSTKAGSNYIAVTLNDKSGTISGNIWDAPKDLFDELVEGGMVRVSGMISAYNGALQLQIKYIEAVHPEEYGNALDLMQDPPDSVKFDDLTTKLKNVIQHSLKQEERDIINHIFNVRDQYELFVNAPAAANVHHAYRHGLLIHSLDVMEICFYSVCKSFIPPKIDISLLLLAALVHDIGKIYELSWGAATRYTTIGQLENHSLIGARIVRESCEDCGVSQEKIWRLTHCINSHHGKPELGAAVEPKIIEAYILHNADMMNSKLEIGRMAQEKTECEWSDPVFALGHSLYFGGNE